MVRINQDTLGSIPEEERGLCETLLSDISEMNALMPDVGFYLTYEDDNNSEQYMAYRIKTEKGGETESIGLEMTLDEVDTSVCALSDFIGLIAADKKEGQDVLHA